MEKGNDKGCKRASLPLRMYGINNTKMNDDGIPNVYFTAPSSNAPDGTGYIRANGTGDVQKNSASQADGMKMVRGEKCALHGKEIFDDGQCADCRKSVPFGHEDGHGNGEAEAITQAHREEARDALLSIYTAMLTAGLGGVGTGIKIAGKAVSAGLVLEGLLTVKEFKDEYDKHLQELGSSDAAMVAMKKVGKDVMLEKTANYIFGKLGLNKAQSTLFFSMTSDMAKKRKPRGDSYDFDRHIKGFEDKMKDEF